MSQDPEIAEYLREVRAIRAARSLNDVVALLGSPDEVFAGTALTCYEEVYAYQYGDGTYWLCVGRKASGDIEPFRWPTSSPPM